jgi:hypothetical protein
MNWQKQLKKMYLDHMKLTSPGFFEMSGGYRLKVKPYSDKNRNGLIRCVIDWIIFSGGTARQTNKGRFIKSGGKMVWIHATGRKPTCDILGVYKSNEIEVIISHQEDTISENIAGGWRMRVGSFDAFLDWWQEYILKSTIPVGGGDRVISTPI